MTDNMEKRHDFLCFSEHLNVSQIMTRIGEAYCTIENESAKNVLNRLGRSNYTMAPVRVDGLIKRFVRRRDLGEKGSVSDYSVEINKNQLISYETELLNLIDYFSSCLENDPFFFILKGNDIVGFVLPADFNKQSARILFYILFAELETDLKQTFQKHFKNDDEWLVLVTTSEKAKILQHYEELRERDLEISKLECAQMKNLLDVVLENRSLFSEICGCSKNQFKKTAEDIRHFRDLAMHPINKLINSNKEFERLVKTRNAVLQLLKNINQYLANG
jgi:hypothetical protein